MENIKSKPVTEICKHLRPISLTPTLSKVAEEFVVSKHIGPILCQIDPNQFGVIPKSSTSMAAISMIHNWSQSTDGSGAAVRIVLFDYKNAFDLIEHGILIPKRSPDYQFQKQSYAGLLIFYRTENKELSSQTIAFRNGAMSRPVSPKARNSGHGFSY